MEGYFECFCNCEGPVSARTMSTPNSSSTPGTESQNTAPSIPPSNPPPSTSTTTTTDASPQNNPPPSNTDTSDAEEPLHISHLIEQMLEDCGLVSDLFKKWVMVKFPKHATLKTEYRHPTGKPGERHQSQLEKLYACVEKHVKLNKWHNDKDIESLLARWYKILKPSQKKKLWRKNKDTYNAILTRIKNLEKRHNLKPVDNSELREANRSNKELKERLQSAVVQLYCQCLLGNTRYEDLHADFLRADDVDGGIQKSIEEFQMIAQDASTTKLKILSFNVLNMSTDKVNYLISDRAASYLLKTVLSCFHVIALQEVHHEIDLMPLITLLGEQYEHTEISDTQGFEQVFLYDKTKVEYQDVSSDHRKMIADCKLLHPPQQAMFRRISEKKDTLWVHCVNVHISPDNEEETIPDNSTDTAMHERIELLSDQAMHERIKLLLHQAKEDTNLLIMGDFNFETRKVEFSEIQKTFQNLGYDLLNGWERKTAPTTSKLYDGFAMRKGERGKFVQPIVCGPLHFPNVGDLRDINYFGAHKTLSDHFPVYCMLETTDGSGADSRQRVDYSNLSLSSDLNHTTSSQSPGISQFSKLVDTEGEDNEVEF